MFKMTMHNDEWNVVLGPTVNVAAGTAAAWIAQVPGPSGAKWELMSARLLPDAAITANVTNYTTFTLANDTTATTIATRSYAATNSVAKTPEDLTIAAAGKYATADDVLSWTKAEAASGLAAGCRVQLRWRRIR